jgi:hypothetical protein
MKAFAWFAFIYLALTLFLTLLAVLGDTATAGNLLNLTELLLSWKVIGGGLAVLGGNAFKDPIAERIRGK